MSKHPAFARMGLAIVALGVIASSPWAGEISLKGRNIQSAAETIWKQVGDDEGHGIGTYQSEGLTFHESGEVSSFVSYGTFDWRNGADWHRGYNVMTYADGATTTSRFEGRTSSEAGTPRFSGTFSYVSGTGRFAGIEGGGSYEGQRYPNRMSVTDWQAEATVPDR